MVATLCMDQMKYLPALDLNPLPRVIQQVSEQLFLKLGLVLNIKKQLVISML
jgi:hypothetical protein